MSELDDAIVRLTHKWCIDILGRDGRVGIGAALNVLRTIGNHSSPEVLRVTAMFLRRLADDLEAGTPKPEDQH